MRANLLSFNAVTPPGLLGLVVAIAAIIVLVNSQPLHAQTAADPARASDRGADLPVTWDLSRLGQAPQAFDAPDDLDRDGVRSAMLAGEPYQGRPTRFFVYYAVPESTDGRPVPGMVLIHGGSGTAFDVWVRRWAQRGYAAIAMDHLGTLPRGSRPYPAHEFSGPSIAELQQGVYSVGHDGPPREQWAYHAVAAVIRSHSFLREQPGVDPDRIGVCGISWGGYLTGLVAAVDPRFGLAIPIYGCGFYGDSRYWSARIEAMDRWQQRWGAERYLPAVDIPMLWINGPADPFYYLDPWRKSYRLVGGAVSLSVQPGLEHGTAAGYKTQEPYAFADAVLREGRDLVTVTAAESSRRVIRAAFDDRGGRVTEARLVWTDVPAERVNQIRNRREWQQTGATLDTEAGRVAADVPGAAMTWFLNLIDDRGLIISTPHFNREDLTD